MSESSQKNPKEGSTQQNSLQEKNLEKMEALLKHSALGVHVLFENHAIARALSDVKDDKDFFDFNKMKLVQDHMTALIAKKTFIEKRAYLHDLDEESHDMLIRTYFHIVENTVRAKSDLSH